MLFNIYWPLIEFFAFWAMRLGFRILDRGVNCNTNKTKKTTVQQYVEIYSGPTYFIHYKYSSILNITFVTFMYGLGLPILFPIAMIALLVLFLVEKAMIFFSYRQPPMYDNKLNDSVLDKLQYAPLLFLAFGYWMFSNHQLFGGETFPIEKAGDVRLSGHIWYSIFLPEGWQVGPAFPLIVAFFIVLVLLIF